MKTLIGYCGKLGSGKAYQMMKEVELLKTTGHTVYLISFADPIKQILKENFSLTKEGKTNTQLPEISELYVKYKVVDSLFYLLKNLKYEKFNIAELDLKAYIARNYEKYEKEFYNHVIGAFLGNEDYQYHFRRLGQLLGTELGRHLIDSIWVDIAFSKIKKIFKQDLADYAFIDDVRFSNERDAFEVFKSETVFDAYVKGVVTSDEIRAKRRNMSLEELKSQDNHASEKEIEAIIDGLENFFIIQND
jgi:hypothetical protein